MAASSILGIGIWIGKATTKINSKSIQNELGIILNYIDSQSSKIDSLNSALKKQEKQDIYSSLKDYDEELEISCKTDGRYLNIDITTSVFTFLGEGIYEYQVIIEKSVGNKYVTEFAGKKGFQEQKEGTLTIFKFVFPKVLKPNQKYRLVFKVGNDKKLYGDFICS